MMPSQKIERNRNLDNMNTYTTCICTNILLKKQQPIRCYAHLQNIVNYVNSYVQQCIIYTILTKLFIYICIFIFFLTVNLIYFDIAITVNLVEI